MTPRRAARTAALFAVALAFASPLLWLLRTALTPEARVLAPPFSADSGGFTLENFRAAYRDYPLAAWYVNSMAVASLTAVATLVLGAPAAYALARMELPGRRAIFYLLLSAMLVPAEVTVIPLFLGLSRTGLSDTYASLAAPVAVNGFGLFLLVQFFRTLPQDLLDAARLEGASPLTVLRRIVLPLSRPSLVTVSVLTFAASWNNFLWPLIVTNSDATRTLPVGLASFLGAVAGSSVAMRYGLTLAAAAAATVPPLLVFLLLQRHFERGAAVTSGLRA